MTRETRSVHRQNVTAPDGAVSPHAHSCSWAMHVTSSATSPMSPRRQVPWLELCLPARLSVCAS